MKSGFVKKEEKELKNRNTNDIVKLERDGVFMAKVIKGFKMRVYPEYHEEYERRHNELWPEMKEMIHEYGGSNYTIFLDKETNTLFGVIELEDPARWDESANTAICRKWWDYMADIMDTNPDNSPVSIDLKNVFHLD